jgi:hypothetical protein
MSDGWLKTNMDKEVTLAAAPEFLRIKSRAIAALPSASRIHGMLCGAKLLHNLPLLRCQLLPLRAKHAFGEIFR